MAFTKVGNLASAFTLLDQNGDKVSLKHVMNKVKTKSHHDDLMNLIKELGL